MKSKDTRRMIKVPSETYQDLKAKSDQLGMTVSAFVRLLVEDWLEGNESDAKMRIPPTDRGYLMLVRSTKNKKTNKQNKQTK